MKLLLTSEGIINNSIKKALRNLAGKPFNRLSCAFIPTAANLEDDDKSWLIDILKNCQKLGFKRLDIVDISALPKSIIKSRLAKADILMFGGGNAGYLLDWLNKSGLKAALPGFLKKKIYVGASAGSMITADRLYPNILENFFREKYLAKITKALGLVNINIIPHLNSSWFTKVRFKNIMRLTKSIAEPIYAIDDNTAISINGSKISVVSEGKWKRFN